LDTRRNRTGRIEEKIAAVGFFQRELVKVHGASDPKKRETARRTPVKKRRAPPAREKRILISYPNISFKAIATVSANA